MFRSPIAINRSQFRTIDTPEDFREAIASPKIDVLPLVTKPASAKAGWCTYVYEFPEAPELEVLSGGVNHKSPRAGALWRQGNLLHFGFAPSPKEMNEAGEALLIDSICYIARFTEDRPIVHTPCVFVQNKRLVERETLKRIIENPKRELSSLPYYVDKKSGELLAGKDRQALKAWYADNHAYLHADTEGKLVVDSEAQKLGVSPARPEFLQTAVEALAMPERASLACILLTRYVPQGLGAEATPLQWQAWLRDNRPYLFFSDAGGYRWYIDPLAKRRAIPTEKLRGPARATLPAVTAVKRQP